MQTIVENASIYTGVPGRPWAEALVVQDDSILAAGSLESCRFVAGANPARIDAGGRLVLPAFNDTHTHFIIGSQSLLEVDLRKVTGKEQFRKRITEHLKNLADHEWLVGGYWNDEYWAADGLPDKSWIEDLTGNRPAILYRHDLHQSLCNTAALEAAGFHRDSRDPAGGTLGRFDTGELNGRVYEKAMTIVRQSIPPTSPDRVQQALEKGVEHAQSLGITAATDMIDSVETIETYRKFCAERRGMRFELCAPLPEQDELFAREYKPGQRLGEILIGPLKGFMDGSLGSRTAYMHRDYKDQPGNRGYLLDMANPPEKMLSMISGAAEKGFASAVHAIGTEAVTVLLSLFEKAEQLQSGPPLRHRVEHAQHISDADLSRFARHGIIASMQPEHLTDDGNIVAQALGKELEYTSYRFNSLMQSGAGVIFNTDWPVVELDPLQGIAAAVTRKTSDGNNPGGWLPEEKVTVQQAVAAYTTSAAFASGLESSCGQLKPGFEADFIMLDTNIFTCEPEEIRSARVELTVSGGHIVYQ